MGCGAPHDSIRSLRVQVHLPPLPGAVSEEPLQRNVEFTLLLLLAA